MATLGEDRTSPSDFIGHASRTILDLHARFDSETQAPLTSLRFDSAALYAMHG